MNPPPYKKRNEIIKTVNVNKLDFLNPFRVNNKESPASWSEVSSNIELSFLNIKELRKNGESGNKKVCILDFCLKKGKFARENLLGNYSRGTSGKATIRANEDSSSIPFIGKQPIHVRLFFRRGSSGIQRFSA